MDQQLKSNLTSSKHWFRLLFMLFYGVCLQVAFVVMTAVVCIQFLFALISGDDNRQLRAFGNSLSQFIFQSFQFLTYNSEEKPFPFADWPEADAVDDIEEEPAQPPVETPVAEPTNVTVLDEPIDDAEMKAAQEVVEELKEADLQQAAEAETSEAKADASEADAVGETVKPKVVETEK